MERLPERFLVIIKSKDEEAAREAWDCPAVLVARVLRFLHLGDGDAYSLPNSHDAPAGTASDIPSDAPADLPAGCRLMAVEQWDSRTFVVFDRHHYAYDFATAHLDGCNDLPVNVVHLRPRGGGVQLFKHAAIERRVNGDLQDAHDMHGWNTRPPFMINHADGWYPVYHAPRRLGRTGVVAAGPEVTYSHVLFTSQQVTSAQDTSSAQDTAPSQVTTFLDS